MKRKFSAFLALFLCLAMCLGVFGYADAAEPETTGEAETETDTEQAAGTGSNGAEEVIYARLDATGKAQSAYAVVALTLTEDGTATHYGDYTQVENLTDTSPIEYENGEVRLTAGPGRYYYQGTLTSAALPWDIEITYTLDGEEIDPADLGGKSGKLEVAIRTVPNESFDAYFTEGFMLQISVTLDAELCENISTRNGTVANAGSDKTITFVVLPGGEGDVGFTADVHDFTMGGFTIAAVPYDMSSTIGDTSEITSGITQLTSAISQLASGASSLSSGAGTLSGSSGEITGASDQIAAALNQISAGLQDFDIDGMMPDMSQLQQLPSGLSQMAAGLSQMASTIQGMIPDTSTLPSAEQINMLIGGIQSALGGITPNDDSETTALATANSLLGTLQNNLSQLTGLTSMVGQMSELVNQLNSMSGMLSQTAVSIASGLSGVGDIDTSAITELQTGMAELAANYATFNEGLKAYTGGVDELAGGISGFASGMYSLNSETSAIPGMIDEMLGTGEESEESGPVSFLDGRNEDTASVQFVISTDGVSATEAPAEEEPEPESQGFFADLWDKIVALFS